MPASTVPATPAPGGAAGGTPSASTAGNVAAPDNPLLSFIQFASCHVNWWEIGGNLDAKFWPWAFHHWTRIDNSMPSRDQTETPLRIATGKVFSEQTE